MNFHPAKSLTLGLLLLLPLMQATATTIEPPPPPPNPPPCSIGKETPGCPTSNIEYRYTGKLCPDHQDKYLCQAPTTSFDNYMICESFGDGADCEAIPGTTAPADVTYAWSKTGRVLLNVYGSRNERAVVACSYIRGTGSVTLTVTNKVGVVATRTEYFNCNL